MFCKIDASSSQPTTTSQRGESSAYVGRHTLKRKDDGVDLMQREEALRDVAYL